MWDRVFKLSENNVTIRTELAAGLTTFMTIAYILAVNPQILGDAGMNRGGVLIATALASFVACLCMAFFANLPFALAPGMGLNAYFAYTVVLTMGYSWKLALAAVFVEGVLFILLSLSRVREAIFNAIPTTLKHSITVGIGFFIAFIGLQKAHLVIDNPATLVCLQPFRSQMSTAGISAILCLIGVIIIAALTHKKIKSAIFIGIVGTWLLGMLMQALGVYVPSPQNKFYSLYPTLSAPDFAGFGEIVGKAFLIDISTFNIADFLLIVFAFLFVDMFDTIGTLIGVASKADMLDKDGKLPRVRAALLADAIGTTAGAALGTSTVTTYVESSAGVAQGGRTGLTALTVGILFLASIVLSPVFVAIPGFATASALIFVGFLMITSIQKIDFNNLTEAFPAYITMIAMPLFYSIAEGIAMGVIAYVIMNMIAKKTHKISWLMYVLAALFGAKYALL